MSSEIAIRVRAVGKHHLMFDRPQDRLKQMIVPRLQRLAGREPRRYYRDFAALNGVSFDVGRGETVGIIGRNGSGKSTLLQIICGTLRPSSGTVEVNGRIAALLELGAGFNPEFTGRENVFLNAAILGLSREETEARFDAIARFADIGLFIDQPVKTYSSGMYVRLAFATAINVDPDILVVDEALAVGDEAFQRKCFARIEDIKDRGGTILFVSHGAQTIVQLCDRAILIDGGEKLLDGRPKMVVGQYQRLVNASAEGAREIRASIIEMRGSPPQPNSSPEVAIVAGEWSIDTPQEPQRGEWAAARAETNVEVAPSPDDGLADYFDPNLRSQSIVELESRGARIRDVRITTLDGKPVNVLRSGRRYRASYTVEAAISSSQLDYGLSLRTVSGLVVAGFVSHAVKGLRIAGVEPGLSFVVSLDFTNLLLPGAYFVSASVFNRDGAGPSIVHGIRDALMFKVPNEGLSPQTGLVDLGFLPEVSKLSEADHENSAG